MSAIGFDIGDSFCKIGLAGGRTLGVMQNQVGKRKTANVVGYTSENRLFDSEAISRQGSNAKNTCTGWKALIGKKIDDVAVAQEQKYIAQPLVEAKSKRVGLRVKYLNKDEVFTPVQIAASLMSFLKVQVEKKLEGKCPDCVIGCPPWWTETERHTFLDAAKIAGLSVSRLMNETTAVALDYGINLEVAEKSHKHSLFIDIGHSNINVSAVKFWRETAKDAGLKVLATASARGVGGRSFTDIVERFLADEIQKKYKLDVLNSDQQKPKLKLRRESEKVKTKLTANAKVPYGIEYLMNDTDVSGVVERKDFEVAAKPVLNAILKPVQEVLDASGLSTKDLFTIEVVGGGSRIPCVKKALADYLKRDLSYHCDADESCAKGLVLQAAMLSPSFRTRNYQVEDITPHPIEISWGLVGAEPSDKASVFSKNNPVPSTKAISFTDFKGNFQLQARYTEASSGVPPLVGRYIVKGFPSTITGEKSKVKVWVKMNINSTVEVSSAQLIETLPEEETPVDMQVEENKKEEQKKEEEKTEGKQDANATEEAKKEEADKTEAAPKEEAKKAKKKVKRTTLVIETFNTAMPSTDFKEFEQKEASMNNTDLVVAETAALRNDLEQYCLDMRSKVRDELKQYIAADAAAKFLEELQQMEDWIYDEGYDAQKSTIMSKLDKLKATGNPIFQRQYEFKNGAELVQRLKTTAGKYRQIASSGDKKYEHIEVAKMQSIVKKSEEVDKWATDAAVKIGASDKTKDPPVTCAAIRGKQDEMINFAQPILNTPKPQPKEEEKKEEAKKEEAKKEGGEKPAEGAEGKDAPKDMETEKSEGAKEEMDLD
mmetsp:Transcript_28230/g.68671  ORF Transcript_28230/g.68671 Transcript_28230/m.68671 type:complete len:827 (-) Transcript_28230:149-2629(-)